MATKKTPGRKPKLKGEKRARAASKKKAAPKRSLLRRLLTWCLILGIWGGLALGGLVAYYAYDLPDVSRMATLERQPSITILAYDGTILGSSGELTGEALQVRDLPPHLPYAVLAIEDRRFYDHPGMDFVGLVRAMAVNLQQGALVQGGSTITQQLAKNLFLTPERTIKRKIQELLLAFWLERKFSKDQILTLYLNRVYLGAGAYGVDAASRRYFGKPATEVTLYEAALLAGLLKAPSRLAPTNDRDAAEERADVVLSAMVDAGFISEEAASRAKQSKSPTIARPGPRARYFSDWLLQEVSSFLGRPDRDLIVTTTLDPRLQRLAEAEVEAALERGAERAVGEAALVALSPDGAVRAMVGGRDYQQSQFNRATQALRQPGSAFKTFVYLAAFEQGWHPDGEILDAPVTVGDWSPENYDENYRGEITLRQAYAESINTAAVRLGQAVGTKAVAGMAQRLGIADVTARDASIALGTSETTLLQMTGAYAAIANGGQGAWPYGILEVRDAAGNLLFQHQEVEGAPLLDERTLARITDVMTATVEWGTGKAARLDRPAAGKTGTSQEFRDAWFIGFTAELVTGVWFGNDDNSPMKRVSGGSLPAQTWAAFSARALAGEPVKPLPGSRLPVGPLTEPSVVAEQQPASDDDFIGGILDGLKGVFSGGGGSSGNSGGASQYPQGERAGGG
ncbi:transglycosylase domain-containing protein [Limibacillus halophilus]